MIALFRKLQWWWQRRRREDDLREELQFHLAEEMEARQSGGLSADDARRAAHRDLGNQVLLREDARAVWSWLLLEQLAQDVRYGFRGMVQNRMFTVLAALSLALGIGANTAIYSFMDAILLRSLPVPDPTSLVVVKWRSKPIGNIAAAREFVLHAIDGSTYHDDAGVNAGIFPFPAFERLHDLSAPVLSTLFAYKQVGSVNVSINGEAEVVQAEYVSGDFFRGLAVLPAAGRMIDAEDDRTTAPVAVLSQGYGQRRFGDAASAIGHPMLVNNVTFTVVGVAPAEFFGVDPAAAPQIYLPMRASQLVQPADNQRFIDQNYYWVEMMGRLQPGIDLVHAQTVLAAPFAQWVASTAANDAERANLPVLRLEEGAAGLDSLRRQYSKPLYVLLTMVGLILAIACANTANLLLSRAAVRTREMAVRLSVGAGRWRIVRQLLTESALLALLSGALGILMAVAGMRGLTRLLANGQQEFTLHAELNGHVLVVTLVLSLLCAVLFGLTPALQATRPALMPRLKDRSVSEAGWPLRSVFPRLRLTQALVVTQIVASLVLLIAAGLFVRTLSNLHSISLGFSRESVLLFELNAPQAGYPKDRVPAFYANVRRRLSDLPGVRSATLSHASLIRAGRSYPVRIEGQPTEGTRMLWAGPQFLTTMQIPIVRGREITESDRQGTLPVVVVSELFAKTNFGNADPLGRHLEVRIGPVPVLREIVGIAGEARYGGLKRDVPPVVYVPYEQLQASQLGSMTYALRTDGNPLRFADLVRQIVREADRRVPVTNFRTQTAEIDQTINQEIVFARLCSTFALLALTIACVGLYATMAYAVARRTNEIGLRMALGAGQRSVIWMVLREVCVLAIVGLAIAIPTALAASRFVESFLFRMKPNDPWVLAMAAAILLAATLIAGYGPARRASQVDPMVALRHE